MRFARFFRNNHDEFSFSPICRIALLSVLAHELVNIVVDAI